MRILVTGSDGQVGRELVKLAKREGLDIEGTTITDLDITDEKNVFSYVNKSGPELIVNAAAYTAVDQAEDDQELCFAVNGEGPTILAKVCEAKEIPLIHISTDYVFDGTKIDPYQEEDEPNPKSTYGISKLNGDRAVANIKKHIILRVAWVFSSHGNNFAKTMLRLGKERSELKIVADQTGSPTWAGDIAYVIIEIINKYRENENVSWGLYHYAGQPAVSWFQFASKIFDEAKNMGILENIPQLYPIESKEYPTEAERPNNSVLDCQKINQELGVYQPDWVHGLRQVLTELK